MPYTKKQHDHYRGIYWIEILFSHQTLHKHTDTHTDTHTLTHLYWKWTSADTFRYTTTHTRSHTHMHKNGHTYTYLLAVAPNSKPLLTLFKCYPFRPSIVYFKPPSWEYFCIAAFLNYSESENMQYCIPSLMLPRVQTLCNNSYRWVQSPSYTADKDVYNFDSCSMCVFWEGGRDGVLYEINVCHLQGVHGKDDITPGLDVRTGPTASRHVLDKTGPQDGLTYWLMDGRILTSRTAVDGFVAEAPLPLSLQQ